MSLCIDTVINDLSINVNFEGGINVLIGDSATGKSYLIELLYNYLSENGHNVELLDYKDRRKEIGDLLDDFEKRGVEIVLIDNADLLMTWDLFERISEYKYTVIVSLKDRFMVSGIKGVKSYYLLFDGNGIKLKCGV